MKKFNKAVALVLATALCVASLAGCGDKKTSVSSASSSKTSTSASASTSDDTTAEAPKEYTYHAYATSLADKWNPHTWETNADDAMLSYFVTRWVDTTVADTEEGEYQIIFEAATSIEDVTAAHQDDLVKYGSVLPEGKAASDVTEGYVYEIKLNPDLTWENGQKINADDYIYSMEQLLNPDMMNYRANSYWDGEYALAGAKRYYYSKTAGYYVPYANHFDSLDAAVAAGDVFIDVDGFWGGGAYIDAEGNKTPAYVNITDETVYSADGKGDDAFSGKDLYDNYSNYFQIGTGYEQYVCVWEDNTDLGASYDIVGFYKVDDYTLRYVCVTATNYKEILVQHFGSPFLVNKELYEANKDTTGDLVTSSYATSKETTMSFGPYRLESFQEGKQYVIVRNENWYGYEDDGKGGLVSYTPFEVDGQKVEQYQTTKIVCDVMTDDAAKQAFLKGELDTWTPSSAELSTYSLSDKMYKQPESYTMRLFFNTNLNTLKEMDNSKGNENSVVMSNENFRKAFSLCINRAEWVGKTAGYVPAYSLINDMYYYDIYNDPTSRYRSSDPAKQAICNIYGVEYGAGKAYADLDAASDSINGYNLTEAKNLMATACQELVAAGLYTEGSNIKIRLGWKKGALDSDDEAQVSLLQDYLNAAVEGSGFGKVTLEALGNITDRYGDVAKGEFAIGYGAWGGAVLNPFTIFRVYMDPDYTDLHEGGCWDPATETLTLNVEGEDVTLTYQEWSGCLAAAGRFGNLSQEAKLKVLAALEENFIKKFYCIPLASSAICEMISFKVNYATEMYSLFYNFGGLRLMTYNYDDTEWAEFVSSQGGVLSYE